MINTNEFLDIMQSDRGDRKMVVQFGKIDPAYTTGKPSVIFDTDLVAGGGGTASAKKYPYIGSYAPVANHRVMLINGVIIGNIKSS